MIHKGRLWYDRAQASEAFSSQQHSDIMRFIAAFEGQSSGQWVSELFKIDFKGPECTRMNTKIIFCLISLNSHTQHTSWYKSSILLPWQQECASLRLHDRLDNLRCNHRTHTATIGHTQQPQDTHSNHRSHSLNLNMLGTEEGDAFILHP